VPSVRPGKRVVITLSDTDATSAPAGSWTHSFEEDSDDVEVYRPTATYAFPPSRRGRRRLAFTTGEVIESAPGPDDRLRPSATLAAVGPGRFGGGATGDARLEVLEATSEIVKIRRR
jgi:hypothetical protein